MGMRRLWVVVAMALAVAGLGATPPAGAGSADETTTTVPPTLPDGSPDVQARSWILVDAATGQVLAGANLHAPQLPASTVKTITALTALRILGPAGLVAVSDNAAARPPMRIGMVTGQVWPMVDALHCLMLVSANDVAYALAETSAGSLEGFALEMAETARRLGMVDSTFADPAGFDHPDDTVIGPNAMSAWDLAIAGRAVLADPVLAPMVITQRYDFTGPDGLPHELTNHNKLLARDPTAIGVKTGYTKAASGTYVAAAERGGRRLLGVVMGTAADIYTPMNRLFDYGFSIPPTPGVGRPEVLPGVVDPAVLPTTTVPTTLAPTTVAPTTTVAPSTTLARTTVATVAPPTGQPLSTDGGGDGAQDDPEEEALNAGATPPSSPPPWPLLAGASGVVVVGTVTGRRALRRRRHRRRRQVIEQWLGEGRL